MTEQKVWDKFKELANIEKSSYKEFSDQDFIESNYLDSVDVIKLISWIEEKYDIRLEVSEVKSEEFRTLQGINNIIERKTDDSQDL